MKHVLRRNPAPAPAIAAAAVAGMALSVATLANADTTTILVTSTPTATNLTSTGQALDSTFTFELGAFTGNFVPTTENVDEWLQYWTPVTDSSGTPLPTATVGYDDSAIPDTDPQLFMNSFTMEVILDHNNSPFLANTQAYIWGYNNRTTGGEWILIKEPAWQWGDNGQSPPSFDFFSVDAATQTVVGSLNSSGVEIQTQFVELTGPTGYNLWLNQNFTAEVLNNPALEATVWGSMADPDGNGIANIIEYLSGTDPNVAKSTPQFDGELEGAYFVFTYTKKKNTSDVLSEVRWSTNLSDWESTGVTEIVIEDLGDRERIEALIPVPADGRIFAQLAVQPQP